MKDDIEIFEGLSDQILATTILTSSIKENRVAPAYLFTGPKSVGQKEFAIRFFEGISSKDGEDLKIRERLEKGNHPDLITIEPTYMHQGNLINQSIADKENLNVKMNPQIRIEQIKNLKRFLSKKPISSPLSMVLMEDVDTLNEAAANALLKTIEEPINCVLVLISSRPEILLATIKSRCQLIPFRAFNSLELKKYIHSHEIYNTYTNNDDLLKLANGSPKLLRESINNLKTIPDTIWTKVKLLPDQPLNCLSLAKEITENLSLEKQLWLIDWMQNFYWSKELDLLIIKRLEKLRMHLRSYVNQRIAWELALLELSRNSTN